MRKSLCNISLYIFCILFSLPLWGQKRVNIEQAEKVAENIAGSFSSGKARGSKPKLSLVHTSTNSGTNKFKTLAANDEVYYYVFNVNTDDGFVVVSGNDIAIPVLGYSNEGGYNEKDIPPALAWWMDQYKQEIQHALDHKIPQDKETKAKWADFTAGTPQSTSPKIGNRSSYTPGTYLVKAEWNQSGPYNNLIKSKLGDYYTGCVATAVAQLMYYWQYPEKVLAPIPDYTTRTLKLNVPGVAAGTPIDWDNMIDGYSTSTHYTPAQAKAVSELMYYVGVSLRMDYNQGGSSSYAFEGERALMNYFGYNAKYLKRNQNHSNWDNILKAQIDALQPVAYGGHDSKKNGGHYFICDGYQYQNGTLYFHFNWGWGGTGDNYCATSALIPGAYDYNFSDYQTITIDIKPTTTDSTSPSNLIATHITPSGAQLNWDPVNGALNYTVEYKIPATPTWTTANSATTAISYPLSGLTAYTLYDWRVKANYSSFSSYYRRSYFTTKAEACAVPTGLTTADLTPNSANLKWNAVSGARDYTVEYKTSTTSWTPVPTPITTGFYDLSGLTANTVYNWKVKANCSGSSSSEYTDGTSSFKTLVACAAPTGLTTSDPTANSIKLNWTTVSGAQNYTIEYKTSATSTWIPASTVSTNSYTLQGLTANTVYNWKVKANCSGSSSSEYTDGTSSFMIPPACIFAYEDNETFATAKPISINTNHSAGIDKASDQDYYKFTLSALSDIVVTLQNLPKDYELKLLNSIGTQIGLLGDKSGTTNEIISLNSQPAETYYVQVYGYNGAFDLNQCYSLKVTTTAVAVCTVPTGLSTDNVTYNSINLKWNAVSGARDYTVEYKTATTSWTPVPTPITTGFYDLSGLIANTTYDWRIKTNCSASSSSEYTNGTSFKTLATPVVCTVPTGLTSDNVRPNAINLKWNAVSGAQSYTVEYKTTTTSWTPVPTPITTGFYDLSGLTANTTYDWRIKTNCSASSSSEYTNGTSFKTLATPVVCTVPTGLTSDNVRPNAINLKWNAVSGAQSYTVEYKTTTTSWTPVPTPITTGFYDLSGLTANTTYDWRIKTNCSASSSSEYTNGTSFKTLATPVVCTVPTGLTSDNVRPNAINLKWNAVTGAQNYTVEYKTSASSVWSIPVIVATTSHPLQGLTANTTYNWRVRTNCINGGSSAYAQGTFTTTSDETACNIRAYEPNSYNGNAHLINLNTTYKAGIQVASDKDFYKFILSAPSDIVITLKDLPQNYDLILKNSAGKQFGLGNKLGTAAETITINTLAAGTYYVQVYGYNRAFDANQCYTLKVATTTTAVCTPPTGLANSNLTANSASLKWNAVSGARDYTVEYKTSTSSAWKSSSVGTTTHPLEGLTPNTTYNWQVRTNCTNGGSSAYVIGSFTTAATSVCTPPAGLATSNLTANSASLKWNAVSGAQSYTVEYKTSASSVWSIPVIVATTSHPLQGLTANTTYNWRVKANCLAGNSSEYVQANFTTTAMDTSCIRKYEPNASPSKAYPINLNTVYYAGIENPKDHDYYRFTLNKMDNIVVTLQNLSKDYYLRLFNSRGTLIASSPERGTVDKAISYNNLPSGIYYAGVYGYKSYDFDLNQCYALKVATTSVSKSIADMDQNPVNDKNNPLSSNVTLYPNPVENIINIKVLVSDQEYTQLTIIDRNGGIVKTSQVKVEDIIRVDVSDLSPNIYHLTILGKNFRFIKK